MADDSIDSVGTGREGGGGWDYAPALESCPVEIEESYGLFIGGEFVEASSGASMRTENPATGQELAWVAVAGEDDIDAAVASARRAYEGEWSAMSGRDRGKYLYRIARIVQERSRELAVLETLDGGKPIRESRDFDLPAVA